MGTRDDGDGGSEGDDGHEGDDADGREWAVEIDDLDGDDRLPSLEAGSPAPENVFFFLLGIGATVGTIVAIVV